MTTEQQLDDYVTALLTHLNPTYCQVVTATTHSVTLTFAPLTASRTLPLRLTVPVYLTQPLASAIAQSMKQLRLMMVQQLHNDESVEQYLSPTSQPPHQSVQVAETGLPHLRSDLALAIYAFFMAIAEPIWFFIIFPLTGPAFVHGLFVCMAAGAIGDVLVTCSWRRAHRAGLVCTGQGLILISTIMASTGLLILLWVVSTPMLIVGGRFVLHPVARQNSTSPLAGDAPTEQGGFKAEKTWLRQLNAGAFTHLSLPRYFYFNTTFLLLLMPLVGIGTLLVYLTIWGQTQLTGHAEPGSTTSMFLSMFLVLIAFAAIDWLIWAIWRRRARPIVSLDSAGFTWRHYRQSQFMPWTDITAVAYREIPNGRGTLSCLLLFGTPTSPLRQHMLSLSPDAQRRGRFWHGVRPEYFQASDPGVAMMVPITYLGVNATQFAQYIQGLVAAHQPNS